MFEPSHNRWQPAALVPKEKLGAWSRWRTAALDVSDPRTTHEPQREAPVPDEAARLQAELAAQCEAACAAGRAEGLAAGRALGLAAGTTEGLEAGRTQGYAEGLEQGLAVARAQADALDAVLQSCTQAVAELAAQVGEALATLALDIARRVIGSELVTTPQSVVPVVQEVLRTELAGHGAVTLCLHPDDAALVTTHLAEVLAERQWRVSADATITRGGCRAQSAYGDIDATLQTRWQQVSASLGSTAPWQPI